MPAVFCYGSNSVAQLQGRVGNAALTARRALLANYARIFVGAVEAWGGGGVASLSEVIGKDTHGSVVVMSDEEFATLVTFEGGYHQQRVSVTLVDEVDDTGQGIDAVTFVANDSTYVAPPSESYKTAIWSHLVGVGWPLETWCGLTVRQLVAPGDVAVIEEWKLPSAPALSLPALFVLINNHPLKAKRWTMPKAITGLVEKLGAVGVTSSLELASRLQDGSDEDLNAALERAGHKRFGPDTLAALRSALVVVVA